MDIILKICSSGECQTPLERRHNESARDFGRRRYCNIRCSRIGTRASKETKDKMAAAKAGLRDEQTNNFKGDKVGYAGLHDYIKTRWGKAKMCERCGCKKPPQAHHKHWFEWANITGVYDRNRENWQSLCVPCHRHEDAVNPKGAHLGT